MAASRGVARLEVVELVRLEPHQLPLGRRDQDQRVEQLGHPAVAAGRLAAAARPAGRRARWPRSRSAAPMAVNHDWPVRRDRNSTQHPVGGVGLHHPGGPALPLVEQRAEAADVRPGAVGPDDARRRDLGAGHVVEEQELALALAVGAVQGGQEPDDEGHRGHARERGDDREHSGPTVHGDDVAEADREEVDAGEVERVQVGVDAVEGVVHPVPDEAPRQDLERDPHGEEEQQRHGAVAREDVLPPVVVAGALADLAPEAPGVVVEEVGRPVLPRAVAVS